MDLTIILRTCGNSGVISNQANRISGTDRVTLILKCIKSLVESINNVTHKIPMKLYVLDDHSEQDFLVKIENIVSNCKVPFEIVNIPDRPSNFKYSFNYSAYEQFRYGRDVAKNLVYTVEDDYLHSTDAIQAMLDAYSFFRNSSDQNEVAIYPYDSTHNYKNNYSEPTRLFYLNGRLWRSTSKSANTIFMHSDTFRRYWGLFDLLATEYGDGNIEEDRTINRIWNNTVIQGGPVCLFSPIPSVAAHISFDEPIRITSEMNDWRERYNEIDINDLTPSEFSWNKAMKL